MKKLSAIFAPTIPIVAISFALFLSIEIRSNQALDPESTFALNLPPVGTEYNFQSATNGYSQKNVRKHPPAVLTASLMNNMTINRVGSLTIATFFAAYLPDKDSAGKDIFYGPGTGQPSFVGHLIKDGVRLSSIDCSATLDPQRRNFWQVTPISGLHKLNGPGAYKIEFSLNGKKFQDFLFNVKEVSAPDGKSYLYVSQPYEDYGFLSTGGSVKRFPDQVDDDTSAFWNFWLSNMTGTDRKKVTVKVEVLKNAKVIAHNLAMGESFFVNAQAVENLQTVLRTIKNTPFYLKRDLLSTDGTGEVILTLTWPSATPVKHSFPFSIKGGELIANGKGNRVTTDPMVFMEHGQAWFMIARKGSTY